MRRSETWADKSSRVDDKSHSTTRKLTVANSQDSTEIAKSLVLGVDLDHLPQKVINREQALRVSKGVTIG